VKKLAILFCLLLSTSFYLFPSQAFAEKNPMKTGIFPGMTITEFKKIYPKVAPDTDTRQCQMKEKIHDLDGKWTFDFKDGKLDWITYDYYVQEVENLNEENFNKCLKGAQAINSDLTKIYGKPTEFKEGAKKFRDPAKDHHWGYEVIQAKWQTDKFKINAGFEFFGGKGEYFFVVDAHFEAIK
jgi:hypothetical protein